MNRKLLIKVLMLLVLFLGMGSSMYAQFLINENFRGKTTDAKNNIVYGDGAYLTVGSTTDSEGEGWIRLTNDQPEQKGYFYVNKSFPSDKGVFVDFEYTIWRTNDGKSNSGAGDGFSIFLFDGSTPKFKLGDYGGALGYAPRIYSNQSTYQNNPTRVMASKDYNTGLSGGFIGLGFDVYGNYNNNEGGKQGEKPLANAMVLRGKTVEAADGKNTYKILQTSNVILGTAVQMTGTDKIDFGKVGDKKRPQSFYRRVQVEINKISDKVDTYEIIVRWAVTKGGEFKEIYKTVYTEKLPKDLKVGFAASTGWAVNNHEVRDLFATTPGGVMIEKVADKSLVNEGDELTYTINLKGQNAQAFDFKFTDDFKLIEDYFTVSSIAVNTYSNNGNKVTLAADAKNLKDVAVTLARLGTISFTIKGKVIKAPNGNILKNKTFIDRATLEKALASGKIGFIDDTKISSEVSTVVVDDNYCGCPPGSTELKSSTGSVTLKSGTINCVSGEVSVDNLIIENNAYLYVNEGARLRVRGTYTQEGGHVSICPKGGIDITGSANFGAFGSQNDAKITLKKNAFFTVQGSFKQGDPSFFGTYQKGKAVIEMDDSSFVEVCGTFTQEATTYPLVNYTGTGRRNSYFIVKAQANGGPGSVLADSDNVNVIAMHTVTDLEIGSKNYCGPNARKESCSFWPEGLTEKINGEGGDCHEAEGILDKPSFEVIKSGIYTGTLPVKVNDVINYTITVKNTGNVELYDLKVVDAKIGVNENISLLDIEESKVVKGSYKITQEDIDRGGVFNQALGTVKTPEGKEIKVPSVDPKPLSPTDPKYPLPDPNYPNCTTCTVTTLERNPSISLVKSGVVNEDAVSSTGNGIITYTFTITNTGNVTLTLKDFTDTKIPSFKPTGVVLGVGQSWTDTATYEITDADTELEKVVNIATVQGFPPKGEPVKGEGTSTLKVEGGGPLMTNPHIYHKVE